MRPGMDIMNYYLSLFDTPGRFPSQGMEQELLNYAHRQGGNMPWKNVSEHWSVHMPMMADVNGGVVALHNRWFDFGPLNEDVHPYFLTWYYRMKGYFQAWEQRSG
jgi:hypothetical protein